MLVDRALMNPLQFDIGHLEEEAALLACKGDEPEKPPKKRKERKRKAQKTSESFSI